MNDEAAFSASPPWPHKSSQRSVDIVVPPFQRTCTADAAPHCLPYHWLEVSELLLAQCKNEIFNASTLSGLLRDLKEIRASKLRAGMKTLEGGGLVSLRGVGAMELYEERQFIVGVVKGLRILGSSREATRRETDDDTRQPVGNDESEDDEIETAS
jgi:GINS complex subunit 2